MTVPDAELAGRLVREAGQLAARMRSDGLGSQQKTNVADIVTAADHAAEALIVRALREARPDDSIVGEEGTDHVGTSGRTWVIDPVDGTYNFFRGMDWWCSALALTDRDDVLLGAVHHPARDEVYVGGPDLPSTRNGELLPRIEDRPLAESCASTYLHPPFYAGEVGAAFTRAVDGAATLRMLGSGTMDHMAVARGQMDVLFQHSVPAWDWLPGSAIVRGVGGAARRTTAAGVVWSVAGVPTAVDEVCAALDAG
ncbi:inositol monophosphatase family protein [Nocardioides sp. Root151]|uniref:inositol monophosphatase family protein n=1 Tax=Nocardioides sp. Root151 TaxID=1736475 RepID=UPI00070355BD|nr:inositol monophosphatase [Nocardioides sp. Root151]KQZ70118.1 fructose 1,6-bisphosphatase [Nocardioides sp. Root151]